MEFSSLENDRVYIKAAIEEIKNVLVLIKDSIENFEVEEYTSITPEQLVEINIKQSSDFLNISKADLNIIYELFGTLQSVNYNYLPTGISGESFEKLVKDIEDIHLEIFPTVDHGI